MPSTLLPSAVSPLLPTVWQREEAALEEHVPGVGHVLVEDEVARLPPVRTPGVIGAHVLQLRDAGNAERLPEEPLGGADVGSDPGYLPEAGAERR